MAPASPDPCGDYRCWWVHPWDDGLSGWPGATQDYKGGLFQGRGALMRREIAPYVFSSNVYWVHGVLWDKYLALGGAPWPGLGYPVSNQQSGSNSRSGSNYLSSRFEGGIIVHKTVWGGPSYEVHGAIWLKYNDTGGPATSSCGFPRSDEIPMGGPAALSYFEYGFIYWSGSSAAVYCP